MGKDLEVDKAKIEVIQNLPLPATLRHLRNFLGHVGFYCRFIQDIAKVSKRPTTLLCKDKEFFIDKEGERAFKMLKLASIKALILQSPNWDLPFEIIDTLKVIMCFSPKNLLFILEKTTSG